ncbi:hypothetical protein FISHEDRAFT_34600 [Fistulina hepatica ATCC 64428]|uniref:EamA domain-containing protein n=1 Tax=Fistulina hepatica ATCC 64428 TaxID=1128425 RepID=A0A0D7ALS7_9AGAR|nr:hypothetical protein FISHEDRAFT_34600 [Fistulina hepatica ATCC 64428]
MATILASLGGTTAIFVFIATLVGFVAETMLTQYVQTTLDYKHPFFLFYAVHSSFAIIFPLHLLYLTAVKNMSYAHIKRGLSLALSTRIHGNSTVAQPFPYRQFLILILIMTFGITYPGLLWFAAVEFSPVSDVTAIWNANAFFAYVIAVHVFKQKWELRRMVGVMLATAGVMVVIYGGSSSKEDVSLAESTSIPRGRSVAFGDTLTLIASVGYALYQVLYKKYAALPSEPYEDDGEAVYEAILDSDDLSPAMRRQHGVVPHDTIYPPPYGLYSNLLTCAVGVCTFFTLGVAFPVLHFLDIERFVLPSDLLTAASIAGIAASGVVFNAGFMILLGTWGPVLVSVSNLLTIVLVIIADILFGMGLSALTFWSVLGSAMIVFAFALLVYDMTHKPHV